MDIQLYMLAPVRPLSDGEANALLARLPDALRERLAGQKGGKRDASLCAYEMLRRTMQDHFGWEALPEISFGAHGKPYFTSCPDVFFSLSHSRSAVLLAVHDHSIGVDIERLRPVSERMRTRFHASDEAAFWQDWVQRESCCKRRGISAVALRGRLMADADPEHVGTMYAILRLSLEEVEDAAKNACEKTGKLVRLTVEELI